MKLDWKNRQKPIIALAPMADMTDSAFCRVVKSLSSPVVFREMVSSEAVVRGNDKTLDMTDIHPSERPLVQQIFGSDPETMAESAAIVERDHRPEGFDINMGCPVYKITHNFNGAALMKEPERATAIVKAMKERISVPLSVKIRAGWEDPKECLDFAPIMEEAGAELITIHGRTKKQGYSGTSDWDMIRQVKERVSIPVFANGDIHSAPLIFDALKQTGCDGVLIARGALGNPWIFSQADEMLAGKEPTPVTLEERIRIVKMHADFHCEQYTEEKGIRTFRKHLSWYFKGLPGAKAFRQQLVTVNTKAELFAILDEMLSRETGENTLTISPFATRMASPAT